MNLFLHSLKTKGAKNFALRFISIAKRFGITPEKYAKNFEEFIKLQEKYKFKTTFPITAEIYQKYRQKLFSYNNHFRFMLHGLYHIDYTKISENRIKNHIEKGIEILKKYLNETEIGFRAPYLRYNEKVRNCLMEKNIPFDSSISIMIKTEKAPIDKKNKEIIQSLYNHLSWDKYPLLPMRSNGLIEIPVVLPDDEILIDRLYIKDIEKIKIIINEIYEKIKQREEMYIMQIHPERISFLKDAIISVLEKAEKDNFWITDLYEIYGWAKNYPEIAEINPLEKTITLKNISKRNIIAKNTKAEKISEKEIKYQSDKIPLIYVENNIKEDLKNLMKEDGFLITENKDLKEQIPTHIENFEYKDYLKIRENILNSEKPLICLSRWPYGKKGALSITGDIDALTINDFFYRAIHFYKEK